MSYVGRKFPNIEVNAIDEMGDTFKLNIIDKITSENKKALLFWYPKDFTFVCPTEIHAFQEKLLEFESKGTMVIGASCDTPEVHFAWLNTPKDNGGIEGVTFPLIADSTRVLSKTLNILDHKIIRNFNGADEIMEGDNVTFRATYLIDEDGKVFHESVNDMPLGRNVDEYIRLIDAYSHVQKHGEVCPANWEEGETAMNATRDGVADYLSKN
jgi:peroxiredoxin (alkyl hydroperoxide reductase subunit C)